MATLKEQDIVLHTTDSNGNPVIQLPVTRLENVEGQDSKLVHTTGNETVAGTKTFSSSPIAPTPTAGDNSTKVATTAFVTTVGNAKAPTSHASTATTYGIGTGSNYGHVKLSDSVSSTSAASSGIAASPKAVKSAYDLANTAKTTAVHLTGDETIAGTKTFSSTITGSVSGNAGTATKLANARTIALSGDVSGSGSFDGSNNLTITATVADDSHNHVISNIDGLQTALDSKAGSSHTHDYLPLAGGQMTASVAVARDVNTSFLGLHGGTGTNNDGAQLFLCGANHSSLPGRFQLSARNSTVCNTLEGDLDGNLKWTDRYVLCNAFSMPSNTSGINLNSGTDYESGAYVRLYGKENTENAGGFVIAASNGTSLPKLEGNADGSLDWNGNDVITAAGGKMTGTLTRNGLLANTTASSQSIWATAGTTTTEGASIYLYGSTSSNKGAFKLRAHDGTNYKDLNGNADGTLTWGGSNLLTSATMMPDYQASVSKSVDTQYNAEADGFIYGHIKTLATTACYIRINGVNVSYDGAYASGADDANPFFYPVKKGDAYRLYGNNDSVINFCPVRGA